MRELAAFILAIKLAILLSGCIDTNKSKLYPIKSLGSFRIWLQTQYLPEKFPSYLKKKIQQGAIPASSAELLIKAVKPLRLPEL